MTETPNNITFPPEDDEFYSDLQDEVRNYFKSIGQTHHGNARMYLKMLVLFGVYFGLFFP